MQPDETRDPSTYSGRGRWVKTYAVLPTKLQDKWVWLKPLYAMQIERLAWSHDDMDNHAYWETVKVTDKAAEYILFGGQSEKTIR